VELKILFRNHYVFLGLTAQAIRPFTR